MKAFIFPGQGSQFPGMGFELYNSNESAKQMFEKANSVLNFDITKLMFEGNDEDLKKTNVTQPAIFIHSVILANCITNFNPDMVAGHSLGEFSAITAAKVISFEDGLNLVVQRANAMHKACEENNSTMAAVIGIESKLVEQICENQKGVVVTANYNSPNQIVISGQLNSVEKTCEVLKDHGAKRAIILPVGGAFHSPLMEPARAELAKAIETTTFNTPICPVYQNVTASAVTVPNEIKENLVAQLTAPVRWTQTMYQMIADGVSGFTEVGPGKVLQGLVKKVDRQMPTESAEL